MRHLPVPVRVVRPAVCALALGLIVAQPHAAPDPVKTASGLVSGTDGSAPGVTAYLGIPYAAAPVGDLRWRAPQPAPTWPGVRQATTFGTSCVQQQLRSRLPWTEEYMTQNAVGEDCLSLNVWVPSARSTAPLAVMVWIYGGGFNEGSSAVDVYDGAPLASRGVIVVSMNYRTGVLGSLAHPELSTESPHGVSGNYGILDQIAALKWVQTNVAAFGGDPAKVTVFGQSAGGLSVAALMRSPLARGLFARAIGMAGPGLIGRTGPGRGGSLQEREAAGVAFAAAQGADSLAALRALPPTTFIAPAVAKGNAAPPVWPFDDGYVLPVGEVTDQVPVMAGFTADDIVTGGQGFGPAAPATVAAYTAEAEKAYGNKATAFLTLYPVKADADVPAARKAAGRDRARVTMDLWAADQMRASRAVYTYYFDRVTPWPEHPEFGAHHTSEVPYVFRTVGRGKRAWEPVDTAVTDRMASYFVNFASTGDPNGGGLPRWPAFTAGAHQTMRLGETMAPMPVADAARLAFHEAQLRK
jgi:para-nitrobenzyl esterase